MDVLISYVLLFGVVYLAWCDFAMDPTKERHSGKKAWAVHGKAKLTETEKRRDRCRTKPRTSYHLFTSRGLFTKTLSWQAKQSIRHIIVPFYDDCVKIFEDFAPNFEDKGTGCCINTTLHFTLPFSPANFWLKTTWLSSPTHPTFLCFPDWKYNWKAAILAQLRGYRQNRRRCWTPSLIKISRMHLQNFRSAGNGAYERKGTTSRVMVASRPKVSFLRDNTTSHGNYGWLFVRHTDAW
jgi:hypothetical protein